MGKSENTTNYINTLLKQGNIRKAIDSENYLGEYVLELDKLDIFLFYRAYQKRSTFFVGSKSEYTIDSDDNFILTDNLAIFLKAILTNGIYVTQKKRGFLMKLTGGQYYSGFFIPGYDKGEPPKEYLLYAKYVNK